MRFFGLSSACNLRSKAVPLGATEHDVNWSSRPGPFLDGPAVQPFSPADR